MSGSYSQELCLYCSYGVIVSHSVKGTSRESMGEPYGFYRREVDYEGLNGVVTTMIYHTIWNIEGIHKLASLSTTLTLNMQL
jgi:hypothetical protein